MKNSLPLATLVLMACPMIAAAQESSGFLRDVPGDPSSGSWSLADFSSKAPELLSLPRELSESVPEASFRGAALTLVQEEISPRIHVGLALYARVDVPGDTSVDSSDNVAYSDIFDIGYGINAEATMMSWITPHWALGGYFSVGWDRFVGASDVDMGTGEFFSFNDQDTVTVIVGAKLVQKFAPFWFWEGRMGLGLVHYGELTFTDVTLPVGVSGLQFFKSSNHGLFDLAGRVGFGDSRVTFDVGLDFRFMGGEARGRDVTNVVDPDVFFVFALDVGFSFRF